MVSNVSAPDAEEVRSRIVEILGSDVSDTENYETGEGDELKELIFNNCLTGL